MTHFIVVPQWQGSDSARAMQLQGGAEAIAGDLPRAHTTRVQVPLEAGEEADSRVRRFSAIGHVGHNHLEALMAAVPERPLTVGGDASVGVTAALWGAQQAQGRCAVVWFSAHADLHDPDTSPSGAYTTMATRALIDPELPRAVRHAIDPSLLILAGTRAISPAESEQLSDQRVRMVTADALSPDILTDHVTQTGADQVFIHVDLDVLDPAEVAGVSDAEPFGTDVTTLTACIRAVRESAEPVGASLTEYAPTSDETAADDLGAILRIIDALT